MNMLFCLISDEETGWYDGQVYFFAHILYLSYLSIHKCYGNWKLEIGAFNV